jgi:hypothetical protein
MGHRDIGTADPPAPTPLRDSIPVGRILARGLRVLDRLGSSPEGPLYQAQYPNGAEVALVVLRSEAAGGEPSRRDRFDTATRIQHPNVAAVYEVGEMEDGSAYVVLEQPTGEALSNLLAAGDVFALPEALDLVLQAAAGLQAAHRAGFVHGSVSPHSILVTRVATGQLQVKLIGFTLDPASRQWGTRSPIPEAASDDYTSPERLVGQPPDERSDIFGLGAVLHHLLTGMPPDRGHVHRSVPKVARAVLDTALAPAPTRRFQTISELDEALKQVASVAANRRRARIRRALLVGTMAAGLALVTGGIWLLTASKWRATVEELPALVAGTMDTRDEEADPRPPRKTPPAPTGARSPAPAPPVARRDAPRARNSPEASDRPPSGASADPTPRALRPQSAPAEPAGAESVRSIETGPVATPPAEVAPPLPTHAPPAEASGRMEQASQGVSRKVSADLPPAPDGKGPKPGDPISDGQTVDEHGNPPRPRSTGAPTPEAVDKLKNRQTEESPDTSEALGYVAEPALSLPNLAPHTTPAPEPRQVRATLPVRTLEDPRPRDELLRDQGLRQSIEDVMRLGVAEDVAEIRAGSLMVSLTPAAMDAPSVMYNLQRLYLAYSAATEYRDEVALELRHGRNLYGWFTRDGLKEARSR